jgi:hypothetical protein
MKKLTIAICLLSAASMGMQARTLTPQEALERVTNTQVVNAMHKSASQIKSSLLVHEIATAGSPDMYIFATPGSDGYMIVGADDVAAPLIAYVDNGTFDLANIPDNMKWWLGEYAKEIEAARKSPAPLCSYDFDRKAINKPAIEPIVTTQWNQGSPYNNNCPTVNGNRTYTGCVATAMAQVMKYYNWPEHGTGSNSYTWNGNTLSQDFSTQTYRWSDMTDTYSSSSSEEAKSAVAELMYSCGISVNMSYSTSGSGTSSSYVETAMINNFGYSASTTTLISRDLFDLTAWQELIYRSIKDYGPVYYSGTNNTSGHAFVCDGYSSDGFFHFNWGWGGISDGYFLLTALDPTTQGIGGSSSGYNLSQQALVGCSPTSANKTFTTIICGTSDLDATYDSSTRKMVISGNFQNQMNESRKVNLGLRITNENNGEVQYVGAATNRNFGTKRYAVSYTITLPELADGTYMLKPVYNPNLDGEAEWTNINFGNGRSKLEIVISNGEVSITPADEVYDIYVDNVKLASPIYSGDRFALTGTVVNRNDEEYFGPLYTLFLNSSYTTIAICTSNQMMLSPKESREIKYVGYPYSGTVPAGTYYLGFATLRGNYLYAASDFIEVTVKAASSGGATIYSPSWSIANAESVNADNVTATGTVKSSSGYFADVLRVYIANTSGTWVTNFISDYIFVDPDNDAEFTIVGSLPDAKVGEKYTACLYGNSSWLGDYLDFYIGSTGVESVETDRDGFSINANSSYDSVEITGLSNISSVAVYSMDAMRQPVGVQTNATGAVIDMSNLGTGIYLIKVNAGGKSYTSKIIKR